VEAQIIERWGRVEYFGGVFQKDLDIPIIIGGIKEGQSFISGK
jgi:hypothetical protein